MSINRCFGGQPDITGRLGHLSTIIHLLLHFDQPSNDQTPEEPVQFCIPTGHTAHCEVTWGLKKMTCLVTYQHLQLNWCHAELGGRSNSTRGVGSYQPGMRVRVPIGARALIVTKRRYNSFLLQCRTLWTLLPIKTNTSRPQRYRSLFQVLVATTTATTTWEVSQLTCSDGVDDDAACCNSSVRTNFSSFSCWPCMTSLTKTDGLLITALDVHLWWRKNKVTIEEEWKRTTTRKNIKKRWLEQMEISIHWESN